MPILAGRPKWQAFAPQGCFIIQRFLAKVSQNYGYTASSVVLWTGYYILIIKKLRLILTGVVIK